MAKYRTVTKVVMTGKQNRRRQIREAIKRDKACSWESGFNINLKQLSVEFGLDFIGLIKKKRLRKILDVGCGGGEALFDLARLFPKAELHGTSIRAVGSFWDSYNSKLKNKIAFHERVSGIDLAKTFKPNYFDLIYSRLGLYHEVYLNKAISQARRILAPGKYLIIDCSYESRKLVNLKGFNIVEERRIAGGRATLLYLQKQQQGRNSLHGLKV